MHTFSKFGRSLTAEPLKTVDFITENDLDGFYKGDILTDSEGCTYIFAAAEHLGGRSWRITLVPQTP